MKVDEVYPIDINTTIGPTGTIKRLFKSRVFFSNNGVEMTIFAAHPVRKKLFTYVYRLKELTVLPDSEHSGIIPDTINAKGWRSTLKSKLKEIVKNSRVLSAYRVNNSIRSNKSLIKEYLAYNRCVDAVIFHEVDSCYSYLKLVGDKATRTVMFIHADGSDDAMLKKTYPKLVGSKTLKRVQERFQFAITHSDKIVFITQRAKELFCSLHPEVSPSKVVAFVNGIDDMPMVRSEASTYHKYRLCTSGSVCERKGQYIIIDAMKNLEDKILKNIHLSIFGTGPDYQKLKDQVQKYSLEKNVTFWGNVPNTKIHEMLSKENIFILMSNNEGLPISILEAMRAGLPVISTKVAGIPEEVDERNGVLINPNVQELIKVFISLEDYNWEKLGLQSRERFEKEFTFEIMRKNYMEMIKTL